MLQRCTDQTERKDLHLGSIKKFNKKGAPRWPCEEIDDRLANGRSLLAARQTFQDTCFAKIDSGHKQAIKQVQTAIDTCAGKKTSRGCE